MSKSSEYVRNYQDGRNVMILMEKYFDGDGSIPELSRTRGYALTPRAI